MLSFLHALSITCSSLFTVVLVPNIIIIIIITCPKNHVHIHIIIIVVVVVIIIIIFILFRFVGDSCKNTWWTDKLSVTARPYRSSWFFSQEISGFGAMGLGGCLVPCGEGSIWIHRLSKCSLMFKSYEQLLWNNCHSPKKRNQMLYSTNNCCQTNGYLLMLVTYKVQSYTPCYMLLYLLIVGKSNKFK